MSNARSYDLVILGGGAAAFAAITEADRRDLSTAMVNTGLPLGGTCVNVGCIPSKHLLAVAETAYEPPHTPFEAITYGENQPAVDWETALDEKDQLVGRLHQENYVDVAEHFDTDIYEGYGRFVDSTIIEVVNGEDAGMHITGEKALIATGSSPWAAPIDGLDQIDYYTSETILEHRDLPESIIVLGGGYIALEWGQILHRIGVDVTILQRSEHVLSGMEGQLGREMQRCFRNEGIEVVTGNNVQQVVTAAVNGEVAARDSGVVVRTIADGVEQTFDAAELFVATGVRPNSEDIGLDTIGVDTDERGAVVVDKHFQTANPDVYAAGDVIGEPMLETVAAKEGNHVVTNAFGAEGKTIDYSSVPAVVFTSPEVASVGTTEREYMNEYGTCTCRTIRMEDVPKAKAVKDTAGLVQVVKHHETDEIVGVHMVASRAADMIPEATLAVKFGLTVDDIIDTVHPFPTFSEGFKHACQAFRRDTSTMSCCVE